MTKQKRIIIDIGHPAQVHHFKNVYWELEKRGWRCLFTAKEKEISIYLLKKYGLKYRKIGSSKKGMLRKIIHLFTNAFHFFNTIKKFKPDLIFSRFSAHATYIAKISRISHVGFTDTETANLLDRITVPFVDLKITGNSYKKNLGKNHFYFNGNVELAYLHPNRFSPDDSILQLLGVDREEPYVVIRYVSTKAHHDVGLRGLSMDMKIRAAKELSKHAKVFITSEDTLPVELEPYKIRIPPELMHHTLAYASLLYGESATMSSECACLGVPAIYLYDGSLGSIEEAVKYGMIFVFKNNTTDQEASIAKGVELLNEPSIKRIWKKKQERFLGDKIDVTAFMVWIAENYPDCINVLKIDPDFPNSFKKSKNSVNG
ncbi:MAG: DUF354 domain-containing protein [Desulfobacterales bacterium]|nr:DUF354 domain-containing protein [Desulfobacterales bacterium]